MATRPRLGFSIPNRLVMFGRSAESLLEFARRAHETRAFESVWVGDSLLAKPRLEALVLLAALSQLTPDLRLGTLCLASFPLREQTLLAIQLASIDRLSGGRLVVGVCAGPGKRGGAAAVAELSAFGVASAERLARLEQFIPRLRAHWGQGDDAATDAPALVEPRPVQSRVPIYIGVTPPEVRSTEDRVVERIARLADGWQSDGLTPARFSGLWTRMRSMAAASGSAHRVREAVIHVPIVLGDDRRAAEDAARRFIARNADADPVSVNLPGGGAFGPPALAVELLAGLMDAGATPVVRFVSDDQESQLDRFAGAVLPGLPQVTLP